MSRKPRKRKPKPSRRFVSKRDAMRFGAKFLELATVAAHETPDKVADILEAWMREEIDPEGAIRRTWMLAHAGPIVGAALIRNVTGNRTLDENEFWALEETAAGASDRLPPGDRVALQCISASLNNEPGATASILRAHDATDGHEGIIEVLICLIKHCAGFVAMYEKQRTEAT